MKKLRKEDLKSGILIRSILGQPVGRIALVVDVYRDSDTCKCIFFSGRVTRVSIEFLCDWYQLIEK